MLTAISILLGIVIGLLLAIIAFLASRRYETPLKRTLNQALNATKEKGEVFMETEDDQKLEEFLNNLPTELEK